MQRLVIAVDGPAASGKGTLAQHLAQHFSLPHLDTGSLYRATAMRVIRSGNEPADTAAATQAAQSLQPADLIDPAIRSEHIGQAASIVSAMPQVRAALLEYQREFAAKPTGAVLDGRDIGTVICPNAPIKIFITASYEARAERRYKQLVEFGVQVSYDTVLADIKARDMRDASRTIAPLTPAADAITIDTSALNAQEVYEKVLEIVNERLK
jgi:cytidylate kinase